MATQGAAIGVMGVRWGAQYIEAMSWLRSALIQPWLAHGLFRGGLHGWHAPCRLCGRWQTAVVCTLCEQHLAPPCARCHRCGVRLPPGHPVGERCALCEDHPPAHDWTVAWTDYDGPWPEVVGALKFQDQPAWACHLGRGLAERVRQARQPWPDVVVPVPVSAVRLRERGYNQAALLARTVARSLKLPCPLDALNKVTHTPRLMSLPADERRGAVQGAFALTPTGLACVAGRHVALVDDVFTSGATVDELTWVLHDAGAHTVSLWVVARTPAPTPRVRSNAGT